MVMYKNQRLKETIWSLYGIYASPSELSKIRESLNPIYDETYFSQVIRAVCDTYGIEKIELKSKSRKVPIPEAKKVFCFFCATKCWNHSLIAKEINLDRSTVSVHIKEVYQSWPKTNKEAVRRLNLVAVVLGLPDQLKFVKAGVDL